MFSIKKMKNTVVSMPYVWRKSSFVFNGKRKCQNGIRTTERRFFGV